MTTDCIITKLVIVDPEFSKFVFGGADIFKKISKTCVVMDKACPPYFSLGGKIFVMNW